MRRWLLTELDPEDLDRALGPCDLGMGFPERSDCTSSSVCTSRRYCAVATPLRQHRWSAPPPARLSCIRGAESW
ncbi:DUF2958 domain-containing protein [Caenimonas soli]|uniref:DUF2958 domain-containing protein n=1 Tax=Caenimonas soli TaxID=2735555 RepID=UPI001F1D6DBE|nr:DUF2958 domain-containing protein [Caenimonas soli]